MRAQAQSIWPQWLLGQGIQEDAPDLDYIAQSICAELNNPVRIDWIGDHYDAVEGAYIIVLGLPVAMLVLPTAKSLPVLSDWEQAEWRLLLDKAPPSPCYLNEPAPKKNRYLPKQRRFNLILEQWIAFNGDQNGLNPLYTKIIALHYQRCFGNEVHFMISIDQHRQLVLFIRQHLQGKGLAHLICRSLMALFAENRPVFHRVFERVSGYPWLWRRLKRDTRSICHLDSLQVEKYFFPVLVAAPVACHEALHHVHDLRVFGKKQWSKLTHLNPKQFELLATVINVSWGQQKLLAQYFKVLIPLLALVPYEVYSKDKLDPVFRFLIRMVYVITYLNEKAAPGVKVLQSCFFDLLEGKNLRDLGRCISDETNDEGLPIHQVIAVLEVDLGEYAKMPDASCWGVPDFFIRRLGEGEHFNDLSDITSRIKTGKLSFLRETHLLHKQQVKEYVPINTGNYWWWISDTNTSWSKWPCVLQQKQDEWDQLSRDMFPGVGLTIAPLNTGLLLEQEGKVMDHCVANYKYTCPNGRDRIFGLTLWTWPYATLHLKRFENRWVLRELKGESNCLILEIETESDLCTQANENPKAAYILKFIEFYNHNQPGPYVATEYSKLIDWLFSTDFNE